MFNFLIPNFLKKYNQYLLKNKPVLYSTRVHWVAYFGSILTVIVTAFCFVITPNAKDSSNMFYSSGILTMVCIIAVVVWLLYVLRFNVFKRFGFNNGMQMLYTFILYFICFAFIAFIAFIPAIVESIKANNAYSKKELENDIHTLNKSFAVAHFDSIPKQWNKKLYCIVADNDKRLEANQAPSSVDEEVANNSIYDTVFTVHEASLISITDFTEK